MIYNGKKRKEKKVRTKNFKLKSIETCRKNIKGKNTKRKLLLFFIYIEETKGFSTFYNLIKLYKKEKEKVKIKATNFLRVLLLLLHFSLFFYTKNEIIFIQINL